MSGWHALWARSGIRALIRRGILAVLARIHRVKPRGIVHLFFHAIPPEQSAAFAKLVDSLRNHAPIISIENAISRGSAADDSPAFTISFDDGFKSTLTVAGRILAERGLPSTVFVASDFVGLGGDALRSFTHERLNWPHVQEPMSEEDLRTCESVGMEVGSHGASHTSFALLSAEEAAAELRESRTALEKIIGNRVRYFAWPFGARSDFPTEFLALAREAGYEAIFSGVSRSAALLPPGMLPRRELNLAWGEKACLYLAIRG